MNPITRLVTYYSKQARDKRAALFNNSFSLDKNTRILDLGSSTGNNINAVLKNTQVQPNNVYIADIDSAAVTKGSEKYGFNPVVISESDALPFEDNYFDIVFCSSVIEHVTIPKEKVWCMFSSCEFKTESLARQREFANEIKRLGQQYFVQTPYKHFPVESHSWLPFVAWLPRRLLIPVLQITNLFWVKKTSPDWYLLNKTEMRQFFDDAQIAEEKKFGLTKSIIALKVHKG